MNSLADSGPTSRGAESLKARTLRAKTLVVENVSARRVDSVNPNSHPLTTVDTTPADTSNLITSGAVHAGLATKQASLATSQILAVHQLASWQSFGSSASKVLSVNSGGDGLEWVTPLTAAALAPSFHPLTTVHNDTGGVANSMNLITSGAVHAGLATKQASLATSQILPESLGSASKVLSVNSGGDGLEWVTPLTAAALAPSFALKQNAPPVTNLGSVAGKFLKATASDGSTVVWADAASTKVAFKAHTQRARSGSVNNHTAAQFNVIEYEYGHNAGTNGYDNTGDCHYKVPVSGVYALKFRALFNITASSKVHLKLRKSNLNGIGYSNEGIICSQEHNEPEFDSTGWVTLSYATTAKLDADDYIRPWFWTNSNVTKIERNDLNIGPGDAATGTLLTSFNEFSGNLLFAT